MKSVLGRARAPLIAVAAACLLAVGAGWAIDRDNPRLTPAERPGAETPSEHLAMQRNERQEAE